MFDVNAPGHLTILKIDGGNGVLKRKNNVIFHVLLMDTNEKSLIKSDRLGFVNFKCAVGDVKQEGDLLCVLTPCQHDIVIGEMCGTCGSPVEIKNLGNGKIKCATGSRFAMVHGNKDIVVNEETALKISLKDDITLLNKRKLSLLVDLDATILHSTDKNVSSDFKDVFHYTMQADQNSNIILNYHTKFRPYLKQFLTEMNTLYEMHIYTFGNKSYADQIAGFIDPDKQFFGQRIISKDDSFDPMKKSANLRSLFPRGDNMVCIIDDRTDVWDNKANCIHVQPYMYFPEIGDINDPYKYKDISKYKSACSLKKEIITNKTEKVEEINNEEKEKLISLAENVTCKNSTDDKKQESEPHQDGLTNQSVKVANNEKSIDVKDSENNEENVAKIVENDEEKVPFDNPNSKNEGVNNEGQSPNKDIIDGDCYLPSLAHILREIHQRFYEEVDKLLVKQTIQEICESNNLPDVKQLMTTMRANVLKGCRVSFSGVIPLNQKEKSSYEYHMLTSLGAEYLHNVSLPSLRTSGTSNSHEGFTSHLICKSEGTRKMKQVAHYITEINKLIQEKPEKLPKNIHQVHLVKHDWLWQSYFFWQKVNENDFPFISTMQQLPIPDGFNTTNVVAEISNNSSSTIKITNKRGLSSSDESSPKIKKIRSENDEKNNHFEIIEDDNIKEIDPTADESGSGISTDSFNDSVDSYNDEDLPLDNVILHYSLQDQMDMFKEVDEAMDEEKFEKLSSPVSSDYYNTDSSDTPERSDDESGDFKSPPKNWENQEVSDDNSSYNENAEIDYGDMEFSASKLNKKCEKDGSDSSNSNNDRSDFDDVFNDCND